MIIKDKKELERFINNLLVLKNEFVGAYVENNVKYRYVLHDGEDIDIYKTEYDDNNTPISMSIYRVYSRKVYEKPECCNIFMIPTFSPILGDKSGDEFLDYISQDHPFNQYILAHRKKYLDKKNYAIRNNNILINYSYNKYTDIVSIYKVIKYGHDLIFDETEAKQIF